MIDDIKLADPTCVGLDECKFNHGRRHKLPVPTSQQLILVASILAGNRVSETFTSSDFTVAKGYLVFVLVFVALTSIIVSARSQVPLINLTSPTN